jgi:hypothetical protein
MLAIVVFAGSDASRSSNTRFLACLRSSYAIGTARRTSVNLLSTT